ncbi:hypothetical protein JCM6882_002287 [Rhodosporidiobolus microsporus]
MLSALKRFVGGSNTPSRGHGAALELEPRAGGWGGGGGAGKGAADTNGDKDKDERKRKRKNKDKKRKDKKKKRARLSSPAADGEGAPSPSPAANTTAANAGPSSTPSSLRKKKRVRLDGDASSDEDFDPAAEKKKERAEAVEEGEEKRGGKGKAKGKGKMEVIDLISSDSDSDDAGEAEEEDQLDDDDELDDLAAAVAAKAASKAKAKAKAVTKRVTRRRGEDGSDDDDEVEEPKGGKRCTRASLANGTGAAGAAEGGSGNKRRTRASLAAAASADEASAESDPSDGEDAERPLSGRRATRTSASGSKGDAKVERRRSARLPSLASAASTSTPKQTPLSKVKNEAVPGSSRSLRSRDPAPKAKEDGMDVDESEEESDDEEEEEEGKKPAAKKQRHYAALDVGEKTRRKLEADSSADAKARAEGRKVVGGAGGGGTKGYKKMKLDQDAPESVRLGDVVEIKTSIRGKGGWYLAVEDIRVLTADLDPSAPSTPAEQDPASSPTKAAKKLSSSSAKIYVKGSWLYSREDLRGFHSGMGSNNAWINPSYPMGPNERVKTDHVDWRAQTMLRSKAPETLYIFDDHYPAAPPGRDHSSPHPLSTPYLTSALHALQPSPYAAPALTTPSAAPSLSSGAQPSVPDYFFGVGAAKGAEGRGREKLDSVERGRGGVKRGGDGRRGTAYVRAAFSFRRQEEVVAPADEEEEEQGEGEQEGKKAKGKAKGKGKKREKVWPLEFTRHSLSSTPYNPRRVQRFSRKAQKWFNVKDLLEGGHYGADPGAAPASSSAAAGGSGAKGKAKAQKEKAKEKKDKGKENDDSLPARLARLAASPIVRGGAYGLIGNSYLVTRASALSLRLPDGPRPGEAALLEDEGDNVVFAFRFVAGLEELEAEGERLVESYGEWERGVKERVEGTGEGKGLAREWRGTGEEAPGEEGGEGGRWLCPESGEAI